MPCRFSQKPPSRTPYCYPQQAPEHHKKTTGPRASTKKHNTKKISHPPRKTDTNRSATKKHATKKCYNPLHKKQSQPEKHTEPQKRHNNILHKHTPRTQHSPLRPRHDTPPRTHNNNNTTNPPDTPPTGTQQTTKRGHTKHTHGGQPQHTPTPQQNKQRKNETKTKRNPNTTNQPVKKFDKFNQPN